MEVKFETNLSFGRFATETLRAGKQLQSTPSKSKIGRKFAQFYGIIESPQTNKPNQKERTLP